MTDETDDQLRQEMKRRTRAYSIRVGLGLLVGIGLPIAAQLVLPSTPPAVDGALSDIALVKLAILIPGVLGAFIYAWYSFVKYIRCPSCEKCLWVAGLLHLHPLYKLQSDECPRCHRGIF